MKKIILANTLAKVWFYLIIIFLVLSILVGYINNNNEYNLSILGFISGVILPLIVFYFFIQLLFKPLKRNRQLYNDFLNGNNIDKYSKNRTWVMICTILITIIFILPTLGLILSLTITQFISLSKQKNIIT